MQFGYSSQVGANKGSPVTQSVHTSSYIFKDLLSRIGLAYVYQNSKNVATAMAHLYSCKAWFCPLVTAVRYEDLAF